MQRVAPHYELTAQNFLTAHNCVKGEWDISNKICNCSRGRQITLILPVTNRSWIMLLSVLKQNGTIGLYPCPIVSYGRNANVFLFFRTSIFMVRHQYLPPGPPSLTKWLSYGQPSKARGHLQLYLPTPPLIRSSLLSSEFTVNYQFLIFSRYFHLGWAWITGKAGFHCFVIAFSAFQNFITE